MYIMLVICSKTTVSIYFYLQILDCIELYRKIRKRKKENNYDEIGSMD